MNAFVQYWSRTTWLAHVYRRGSPLGHTAGNGFGAVRPGDLVYVVGREADELLVLGRLVVAAVAEYGLGGESDRALFTQQEAENIFQAPVWEARHHLLARPATVATLRFDRVLDGRTLPATGPSVRVLAPAEVAGLAATFE